MYHEARTDRKLESLSDAEHRTWFNLLCFASSQETTRGEISGYDRELLAVEVARGDTAALESTLDHLQRLRIISVDGDRIVFLHFKKRQYTKPSDEPAQVKERVTRSRNAKRNANNNDDHTVKRVVTPCIATDTDTEAESDTESELPKETNVSFAAHAALNGTAVVAELTMQQQTWAALRDALDYSPVKESQSEKGAWNKAIRELLHAGERPQTIGPLVEEYRSRWPAIDCTPMALVKNLSLIRSARPKSPNGRSPPLEPFYMTAEQSAAHQAQLKRDQDALGDSGKPTPFRRKQP